MTSVRRFGVVRSILIALYAGFAATSVAPPVAAQSFEVDRVALRFTAPELGGSRAPRFVFARVLSFEARVEALADPDRQGVAFRERHVSAAIERHIAETLLASLRIDPEPSSTALRVQADAAARRVEERVGGREALLEAARLEGISERELVGLFLRQARASLYLDRMVAPMLAPSDAELRSLYRNEKTPYRDAPFETILPALRRWYVAARLQEALASYYQNARARLEIVVL